MQGRIGSCNLLSLSTRYMWSVATVIALGVERN